MGTISEQIRQLTLAHRLYAGYRQQLADLDAGDPNFNGVYKMWKSYGERLQALEADLHALGILDADHMYDPC